MEEQTVHGWTPLLLLQVRCLLLQFHLLPKLPPHGGCRCHTRRSCCTRRSLLHTRVLARARAREAAAGGRAAIRHSTGQDAPSTAEERACACTCLRVRRNAAADHRPGSRRRLCPGAMATLPSSARPHSPPPPRARCDRALRTGKQSCGNSHAREESRCQLSWCGRRLCARGKRASIV